MFLVRACVQNRGGMLMLEGRSEGSSGVMVSMYFHGCKKCKELALKPQEACFLPRQEKSFCVTPSHLGQCGMFPKTLGGSPKRLCHSTNRNVE